MNTLLVFICILALVGTSTVYSDRFEEGVERELDETSDTELGPLFFPMIRHRRHPKLVCGENLMKFVKFVCGGACTFASGVNIATHCCTTSCEMSFIKASCCPSREAA
ncbi:unnamed protein product [Caenorhabditis sp. 36 PRJEB53466]|nr:unnamed protein product [Caenorhabditis sp. 36 PRJEB53466]